MDRPGNPALGISPEVVPTNLPGVFASVPVPDGFDPSTASDADLSKYGLLIRRPQSGDSPELRDAWDLAFAGPWRAEDCVVPYLVPQPGKTHVLRGDTQASDGNHTTDNWSGGVVQGTWVNVIGRWRIPSVSIPGTLPRVSYGWDVSNWVGIDGCGGSDDVLQTGVLESIDAAGDVSLVAWYEWFAPESEDPPSPPYIHQTNIPNFPVAPGDDIYCSVAYLNNKTAGGIFIKNVTNGKYFSITLAPPPGASFSGNTAEWIVEAPDGGVPPTSLPDFTPVTFTEATCQGPNNNTSNPEDGANFTIVGNNFALTRETLVVESVTVSYAGPVRAVSGRALANFAVNGTDARAYYLGNGYHVHEIAWQDPWTDTDLTATANAAPAAPGTALTSVGLNGSAARVYYTGTDGLLHELGWLGAWQDALLPGTPGTGSALACFAVNGTDPRVHYLASLDNDQLTGSNFYVSELAWQNGGWVNTPL
jgi:hypothetical protein